MVVGVFLYSAVVSRGLCPVMGSSRLEYSAFLMDTVMMSSLLWLLRHLANPSVGTRYELIILILIWVIIHDSVYTIW